MEYESKIPHLEKWIPNQLLLPSHGHQHKQLIGQSQKPTIFCEACSPVQGSTDRLYFIGPGFFKIFGRSGSRFPNFYWSFPGLVLEPDRLVMNKSVLIRWSLPVRKTIQKKNWTKNFINWNFDDVLETFEIERKRKFWNFQFLNFFYGFWHLFYPFSNLKLLNKTDFKDFLRILIKIGFYHFERHPKSSFHPKFGSQKFIWPASWKIFVLRFLKDRFKKLLKS